MCSFTFTELLSEKLKNVHTKGMNYKLDLMKHRHIFLSRLMVCLCLGPPSYNSFFFFHPIIIASRSFFLCVAFLKIRSSQTCCRANIFSFFWSCETTYRIWLWGYNLVYKTKSVLSHGVSVLLYRVLENASKSFKLKQKLVQKTAA